MLADDRDIGPVQADRSAHRLGEGLLRSEPGSQRRQPEDLLPFAEEPLTQPRGASQGLPEAVDVDDVDADADDAHRRLLTRR